jgi:hypothetical protein
LAGAGNWLMEGELRWSSRTEVDEGSREPEGEGGGGFHIAQTGRRLAPEGVHCFSKAKRTQSAV